MTYICYRGIEISARMQYVLLGIEVVVLVVVRRRRAGQGLRRHGRRTRSLTPSLSWLWPVGSELGRRSPRASCWRSSSTGAGTPRSRSTRRPRTRQTTPGRAAVISTLLLLGDLRRRHHRHGGLRRRRDDGHRAGQRGQRRRRASPRSARRCSATARSARSSRCCCCSRCSPRRRPPPRRRSCPPRGPSLSMGAYRALPRAFATDPPAVPDADGVHALDGRGLDRLLRRADHSSARTCWPTRSPAIGLLIAFYYGLTGFACVWDFRARPAQPRATC